ncbi:MULTISPECIES: DUF3553 domain-containing protein [Thalassobaculum]|uniref:DUF3553 domain-containing protein n=1 Tax=Thalassobaculum litoreum DSM 18839 TaxID=1123362 RepID=A0A8G2BKJ0_9PROT|nr:MULTISPECIES: DUF3553 domain-containing protein [Thalassobaculum]SDG01064.1 Protein of unknown function [Thalassobaculum litoreum DSM 18839]
MEFLSPGGYVRLEGRPDWGLGQIQSVVGSRVTVNFEHAGKQLINTDRAMLLSADTTSRSN